MTYRNIRNLALAVALVGFVAAEIHAQSLNMTSAIRLGGTSNDEGERIAVDAAGNVYVTGTHANPIDIDPGPGTVMIGGAGPFQAFVAKFSSTGTLIWAKNHVAGVANSFTLAADAAGNVYTAGWLSGPGDFDPGPGTFTITSVGGVNMFVSKLDSAGNFVWAKAMLGDTASPRNMAVDAAGNVYLSGNLFGGPIDFDPGAGTLNLTGTNELFIVKLDSAGNFGWAFDFPGTNALNGNGMALDAAGNVYATAALKTGTADLDPGAGTAFFTSTNSDPFVLKLTAAGAYVWAKIFVGGIGAGFASDLALDAAGNVHATGYFLGTVDFDPGAGTFTVTSNGFWDIYVVKLDNNGNYVWARGMGGGGGGTDQSYGIAVDTLGNVYTTGAFRSATPDFDPGAGVFNLTNAGVVNTADIFISMLDTGGNFVAAARIGGTNEDSGNHLATSPSGSVYVIGTFELTVDFDTSAGTLNLTSAGARDIFVIGLLGSGGGPGPGPGPGPTPIPVTSEGSYAGSTGTGPGAMEGSFGFGARGQIESAASTDGMPRLDGPFPNTLDGQKRSHAPSRVVPGASLRVLNVSHQQGSPSVPTASGWRCVGYALMAAVALALAVGLAQTVAARWGTQ